MFNTALKLTILLVVLKVTGLLALSWFWVFSPVMIVFVLLFGVFPLLVIIATTILFVSCFLYCIYYIIAYIVRRFRGRNSRNAGL